jgi:hypothetical protein
MSRALQRGISAHLSEQDRFGLNQLADQYVAAEA